MSSFRIAYCTPKTKLVLENSSSLSPAFPLRPAFIQVLIVTDNINILVERELTYSAFADKYIRWLPWLMRVVVWLPPLLIAVKQLKAVLFLEIPLV